MRTTRAKTTKTVLRHKISTERFVMLPHSTARDRRLSWTTRGILNDMLTRPPDWDFSADRIAEGCEVQGRKVVLSCLNELETHGYLHRETTRQKNGHFLTVVTVSDIPVKEWAAVGADKVAARKWKPEQKKAQRIKMVKAGVRPPPPESPNGTSAEELLKKDGYEGKTDMTCPPLTSFVAGAQIFEPEWRETDRQLFEAVIGGNLETDRSKWKSEDPKVLVFTARAFYDAFRKKKDNPVKWPGRWVQSIEESGQLDDWLIDEGLTIVGA